ncbi:DNA polymerase III subunit gamma/tau, partial [Pseudoflavonifractor phocaeensis]|nr:DNA polymerase III subunit gamma/tau [Pseudoflavonifractor phocaeensis]
EYVFDEPAPPRPAAPVRPAPTPRPAARPAAAQPAPAGGDRAFWPSFAAGLRGKVPPSVIPYLNNPAKVTGVWKNGLLTLWTDTEFTRSMLNKPAVLEGLTQAAAASFGGQPRVSVVSGKPPAEEPVQQPPAPPQREPAPEDDALNELLAFGEQFDNIVIQ